VLPEELSFWCAGHSGPPGRPLNAGNYVRLRDAATHQLLAESRPPRNDTARPFTWSLEEHAGKRGYLELVDGDAGNAYAWLAVGRFSLAALNPSDTPRKQQLVAAIVARLKLNPFRPQLAALAANGETDRVARTAIAQALVALQPDARAAALAAALADVSVPDELALKIGQVLAVPSDDDYLDVLREVMKRAATRLQAALGDTLAGSTRGASVLLLLVEEGHVAPRLLRLPNLQTKLAALDKADLQGRARAITAKLPADDAAVDALITDRRRALARAMADAERGKAVFTKHCASCHQIAGQGATIGPQLDGIGNRGLDRVLEDVLDPNRNVDVAFRTTTLRLTDGRVVSGLVRREEPQQLILADAQGKEFSIAKSEIEEQQKTPLSLMPANVGEILSGQEFFDLVGYLVSQRAAQGSQ
jgi:putative heme-binding domain-containing protein